MGKGHDLFDFLGRHEQYMKGEITYQELHGLPPLPAPAPQAQYSLTEQLWELIALAEKRGLYDAADFVRNHLASLRKKP